MKYWLVKSEPSAYSIQDMRRDKKTNWGGVRNYQARNFLRAMQKGDLAFFYHSNAEPSAIAGVVEIAREAYPDPEPGDDRWSQVDVKFVSAFAEPLTLEEIKRAPALAGMALLKSSRLSVQPVAQGEWDFILQSRR